MLDDLAVLAPVIALVGGAVAWWVRRAERREAMMLEWYKQRAEEAEAERDQWEAKYRRADRQATLWRRQLIDAHIEPETVGDEP